MFTKAHNLLWSQARKSQSTPSHTASLRSILILSSHIRPRLPSGLLTLYHLHLLPWKRAEGTSEQYRLSTELSSLVFPKTTFNSFPPFMDWNVSLPCSHQPSLVPVVRQTDTFRTFLSCCSSYSVWHTLYLWSLFFKRYTFRSSWSPLGACLYKNLKFKVKM
jgi:hypothetical protein